MDCPVCKYPNPSGATHCGMCQEVFNRSAAQNYLHAVRRERLSKEPKESMPEAVILTQHVLEEVQSKVTVIDWAALFQKFILQIKKYRKPIAIGAGAIVLWILASYLFSAGLWYHLFGKKYVYAFPAKESVSYLVGTKTETKSWSERQGRLDTPLENLSWNELGTVVLERKKDRAKNANPVVIVRAKEWIQISGSAGESMSRALPKKHPSLADARLILDKKGAVLERRYVLSPRLAKSVPFIAPRIPPGRLHAGRQWTEEVEWLDVYNDWQIVWKGTLHWTLGELEPCREDTCVKMTYTAELEPRLKAGPHWAKNSVHRTEGTVTGEGTAFFDTAHQQLVSNTFSYDGILRLPIDNLARIPWEYRVGNGVRGPGDIVIRLENKIDVHKN